MRIEIYQDEANEFRARAIAANGKVIMATTEGYKNRVDCVHAVRITLALNDLFRLSDTHEGIENDEEEDHP